MWLALSKVAVCFMTAFGRGQDAAKRLLGSELDGVLVTDQYAGYRFIDSSQRQLCWAHVLRNVAAIADSGEKVNQPIGADWMLLANSVFRVRHGYEQGVLSQKQYQRRLERCRQSWRKSWGEAVCCAASATEVAVGYCSRDDEMLWRFLENDEIALTNNEGGTGATRVCAVAQGELWRLVTSGRAVSAAHLVFDRDSQAVGSLSAGMAEGRGQCLPRKQTTRSRKSCCQHPPGERLPPAI